jgi:hypothetical protein
LLAFQKESSMTSKKFWHWTAVPVIAAALAVPSLAIGSQTSHVLAATGTSMSASAPCGNKADVTVRVTHRDGAAEPDRYRVSVREARPHSRWELQVSQYQGDSGSVARYPIQIANNRGRWLTGDAAERGYITVDVWAKSRAGQVCKVSLSGRVSRL